MYQVYNKLYAELLYILNMFLLQINIIADVFRSIFIGFGSMPMNIFQTNEVQHSLTQMRFKVLRYQALCNNIFLLYLDKNRLKHYLTYMVVLETSPQMSNSCIINNGDQDNYYQEECVLLGLKHRIICEFLDVIHNNISMENRM